MQWLKKASHKPWANEKMGHGSWTASQNSGRQVFDALTLSLFSWVGLPDGLNMISLVQVCNFGMSEFEGLSDFHGSVKL